MSTPGGQEIRFFRDSVAGRRGEILDAAASVFYARGYDGGTMREIAELVGISEPALYRHFSGKEDLFEQFLHEAARRILSDVDPIVHSVAPENVDDVFSRLLENRISAARTYLPVVQTVVTASMHNPQFMELSREELLGPATEHITEVVRMLDERYGVDAEHTMLEQRARLLIGLFIGAFVTGLLFGDNTSMEQMIEAAMGWVGD